jgi:signal transduction histidine kinase
MLGGMRAPFLVGGTLLAAIVAALIVAERIVGAPRRDIQLLAIFLTLSGVGSLALGALVIRLAGGRIGTLRLRLALASAVGLLVTVVNVTTTSALMFLNAHDLTLLLLLLAFSAVVSLAFAYVVGSSLTAQVGELSKAARRLAVGDLSARVGTHGSDELGRLAATFDDMAEQLQAAFDRQAALEAGRRELLSAVSHDLRTPLATTRAMVEAISDGVVTEPADISRYLGLILRETQHLSRLIDDLFELSQIDSGSLRLYCAPIDLAELVSETVDAYHAPALERDLQIEQVLAPPPICVDADAERLQRVLRNLLDNALRHTPSGGRIEVRSGRADTLAELSVSDSGPGVAEADLQRIFESFYRGERSRRREEGPSSGAGLGLAIARGLVQAHHGRIWAEPSPMGGVSVQIRLPLLTKESATSAE